MKKSAFIYGSLLAALLAEGADLTRDEINRKLANLAKSTPPTKLSPGAMCYDMAAQLLIRKEFSCPICGTKTIYGNAWKSDSAIDLAAKLRGSLPELNKLGLNIRFDETGFCSKCNPDKRLFQNDLYLDKMPEGTYLSYGQNIKLPEGTKIRVHLSADLTRLAFSPELWIEPDQVDSYNIVTDGKFHIGPGSEYPVVEIPGSIRVMTNERDPKEKWTRITGLNWPQLAFPPDFKKPELPTPPTAKWVITINGKSRSVPIHEYDVALLKAFLSGKKIYKGAQDQEISVKGNLDRLRELLGEIKQK